MSKKITSFVVLLATLLLTLPSHAQVQKQKLVSDKNAKEMRTLQKNLNVNPVEMAKQKKLALVKAAKDAAKAGTEKIVTPPTAIANWDWAAHAPKQFAPHKWTRTAKQHDGMKVKRELKLSSTEFGGKNTISKRAATVDFNGIITAPDEGVHKYYTREGMAYFSDGWDVYIEEQSGHVEMVQLEDGTVYLKDLVSHIRTGAWVKGTISGNTITIPANQPIYYNENYYTTLSLSWGAIDWDEGDCLKDEGDITFTIDGDVIKLNGSDDSRIVAIFWDDDEAWSGYGDYETVWTLDEDYVPPTPVELPAGATVESWYADGFTETNLIPEEVSVAFVGNDVYVSGIFADFPESWMKGTIEGNKISFPTLQYIGFHYEYGVDCWTYAADFDPETNLYDPLDAVTFTYDAAAKTMTMDPDQILALNAAEDRLYYVEYISELTLSANPIERAPIVAPYTADFSTMKAWRDVIVIDNNRDFNTWDWSITNYAYYLYSDVPADDYLVLPIQLEANKNYNVSVTAACAYYVYPEKFEVKVGKVCTAEGLNITAIGETVVASGDSETYDGSFTTDEAGTWYVAVHAISDPDQYYLMIQSLTIEAGADGKAPAAPALEVTPGAKGALSASGTVTIPTTTVDGSNLTDIEKVVILCDDKELTTITGNPGEKKTFTQESCPRGLHTYQAVPYNAAGQGVKSAKVTIFVGADVPTDVENVQITGTTENTVTLTWDPVTVGVNGGYVNPDAVEYAVVSIETFSFWGFIFFEEGETLATVPAGVTTATVSSLIDEGEARYEYFGVKAIVEGDMSDPTMSVTSLLAGAPYELPIMESFTGQQLHYVWDYNDNTFLGVSYDASDDDDCALALTGDEAGEVTFETFKLDLKAAAKATVLFDGKKGAGTVDKVTVYGITPDGKTTDIQTITLTDEYQTYKVVIPADLKKDRWDRVGFKINVEGEDDIVLIDNIKVLDFYEYDLSAAVDAPKSVLAGDTAAIKVTVKNEGENAAKGYSVVVKAGEKELLNTTIDEELKSFETKELTAELATTVFDDAADLAVTATIVYANDLNPDNDKAEAVVSVKEPTVPRASNVTAEETSAGVVVAWTAPDLSAIVPEEVTEDFENGTGGWTFVDADGDGNNWSLHVNDGTSSNQQTHSGDASVSSESYSNDTNQALFPDNWLISPDAVLDGTFKFWAVGQDPSYCREHFQVFVSTTSATDVTTFEAVGEEFVATDEFKEYTVDLSSYKGAAGWVAIRHYHVSDEFMLVVDDITYLAGTGVSEIAKFNIYLDGELATSVAADQATATIEGVVPGDHKVAVSVVYTNGRESKPAEASVTTDLKTITVITKPVDVYAIDGKLIRKQTTSFEGLKGVYIVDGKKVILK